jgi:hypothetical protein
MKTVALVSEFSYCGRISTLKIENADRSHSRKDLASGGACTPQFHQSPLVCCADTMSRQSCVMDVTARVGDILEHGARILTAASVITNLKLVVVGAPLPSLLHSF